MWFINLYNFLDGINGYSGGEALFLALGGFFLFGGGHFLVLAAAVLGFLYWNWGKAKIFMGDVGSTLLGYNIAIFTIYYANENPSNFWIWIILFALFWFDATVTLIRRKLNGEQLSLAHKKHAYQRLVQSGWRHVKVSSLGMALNFVLFLLIFFIPSILISLIMAFILLSSVMIYVDKQKGFS
ncbi:MAG: Undecaprenyl-phosphate alpha-N-acetylglucosaminyl 1-phosphate transferase [uncultured Sulfurimonas sp.]|nr:MAG: Undecaprenyl-phosphate alpha-N-acetylglucosaminyl 1-phosphate transferase [uncultured Sulfurimonas sp.]